MRLSDFLRAHDLLLSHPGHGHNDGDMPVFGIELERLDREFAVYRVTTPDDETPRSDASR
jgi:hypothetical protein